ncbi:hypothetical protein FOA22_22480 [Heyndrickxia oleronia]|uniref:hypothetical protein n=1 Tax=Heyndrickxia oleronia TaxID=38875 RepID=UPI00333B0345
MSKIVTVKFDNEPVHVFDSTIYIYQNESNKFGLNLEFIITEIVAKKYHYYRDKVNVTFELSNGMIKNYPMSVEDVTEVGNAEIPVIFLHTDIPSIEGFEDVIILDDDTFNEKYPELNKNISIEEIRKVEMPKEDVDIEVNLPIDLAEWIYANEKNMSAILEEALHDYWKKKSK